VWSFDNVVSGIGITPENEDSLRGISLPYAIARQGQRAANNEELVQGFFELDNDVFSVSSEPSLIQTKKEGRVLLGNWPLNRWIHLSVPPERLVPPGLRNLEETQYSEQYHSTGCLSATPLRYGDIETDGTDELVLVLNDELIVFSPKVKKIVFAMFIDASDWWPWGEEDLLKEYILSNDGISPLDSELYHGNSHSGADLAMSGQFMPALRAYSKLFVGDFDNDQNYDIIKWEKTYTSNKKTEAPAWVQLRSELIHYKKDTSGEYIPQPDTSESTIQGWLTTKNQTWQSGFPSKSECAGQEGQLIPEMHDLLLNDPDVLK
jgi:hypothetical protein